ncbi:MAG: DUF1800 domain-containing protein [Alphaproteobacteria bacterium]|nr:DUF1800 domain-containing protein [Alphaproteobacteria bacterium]
MSRIGRRHLVGLAAASGGLAMVPRVAWAAPMGSDLARHLLLRTAWGPTPAEIAATAAMDYGAVLDRLLDARPHKATTPVPEWVTEGPERIRELQEAGKKGQGDRTLQILRPLQEQARELRNWWVAEMLVSERPLVERMTWFWHNHFTSGFQKVRYVPALYRQNELYRAHALGNFATLLKAVARDPAMLVYLDGVRSVARNPNENFGRELLELFTLGEGHYGESDIKAAARAFTGRTIDRETFAFQFNAAQHDGGEKVFLGKRGSFDGDAVLDILLAHPRTAETLVEKLWREFVSLEPDAREVKRLAGVLRGARYEMRPLLRALFTSPAFLDPANRAALIKSPADLIVGTVRVLGLPVPEKTQLVRMMSGQGQVPFDPPNVKGWPGGTAWISTHTLLLRQQQLRRIVEATTVSVMEGLGGGMRGPTRDGQAMAPRDMAGMDGRPVEGRSLRGAGAEARLGPSLRGVDPPQLVQALLARAPLGDIEMAAPGVAVAQALLDPAYQLK